MPRRPELLAQLAIVVDLAVQHDRHGPVLVEDRLVSRVQVDDAQPLDAESHAALTMDACGVRPTMPDHRAHPGDQVGLDLAPHDRLAGNAAHQRAPGSTARAGALSYLNVLD